MDNESAKITTSKGITQGMACVTAADEKHQIIVHAQVFGMAQEQATLIPVVITMIRLRLDFSAFPCFIIGLKKIFLSAALIRCKLLYSHVNSILVALCLYDSCNPFLVVLSASTKS